MKKKHKGLFITFEGGEGVGKSTLIERVFDILTQKGHALIKTREPGGTFLGKEIRKLLLHQETLHVSKESELFLYLSDRAQHVQEVILPSLRAGKIVLCDRFNDSTLAYQGAARALNVELITSLCSAATNGLVPDLTLFLDLDPVIGLRRAMEKEAHDRLEKEPLDFHQKVREAFLSFAKKEPDRFHVIDASQDKETVTAAAIREVEAALCL
ncbi:MAG: dTMP kinase [Chlamydiia bacterium]|nr:dTMP kinase [Chlamydiia bacterium]